MLDVNLVLVLVTLATNKPYWGLARQTWDPILLGVVLIGVVLGLRRWFGNGDRYGFTASRILSKDMRALSVVGTASAALHATPGHDLNSPSTDTFKSGGGRSGGAGASGSF